MDPQTLLRAAAAKVGLAGARGNLAPGVRLRTNTGDSPAETR